MKAVCRKTKGEYPLLVLPNCIYDPVSEDNFVLNVVHFTIDSNQIGFCLTENQSYEVFGMLYFSNQIRYLIQDDNGIPAFLPFDLFEIADNSVCFDWEASCYYIQGEALMWIGYPVLSQSYNDFRDLFQLKREAVSQFLKYKKRIEEYSL